MKECHMAICSADVLELNTGAEPYLLIFYKDVQIKGLDSTLSLIYMYFK